MADYECSEKIGEYEYNSKDLIGHGAFAVVFKGRHQKVKDHVVAIKCVSKGKLGKSPPLIGKEIKILQELTKLQHKNVVCLLECVDSPKNLYIVIEYCNGGDLSEYLQVKKILSEDTIRFFLRQIAEAMKVLNQKEVVHRDLKPQNILLCHSGAANPPPSQITLKIADFGFARFLGEGAMAATLCGSPMYMAPEVIMSLKYDAKADLWSIGTIVYQCLTGKAPFMARDPQQLKHYYEKNANLAPSIPNGTSHDLTDLLIRLMKRDAKDRMDFDELFNHPFLKAQPRSSSPVPVPMRGRAPSPTWEEGDVGGEEMASSPPSPLENSAAMYSGGEQRYSPPSPIEQDFVVVPANFLEENKFNDCENKNSPTMKHQLSDPNMSPSPRVSNQAFKKSSCQANINLCAQAVRFQAQQELEEGQPMQVSAGISSSSRHGDPVPVPTQKHTYAQIEHSLQNSPASCSPTQDFAEGARKGVSPLGTSPSSKDSVGSLPERKRRDSVNSIGSDAFRVTDLNSFTPPTVQFSIGTPPTGGRMRGLSGTTPPSGRQTPTGWRHQATPPQNFCGSPLRSRSGAAIPETDCTHYMQRSGSSGRLSGDNFFGQFPLSGGGASPPFLTYNQQRYLYGGLAQPQHHCCCGGSPGRRRGSSFENNSPNSLEGLFIPELPEETLLEKEHNDTLAKLHFVWALVKCILELAKTRSSPLSTALFSSFPPTTDGCEGGATGAALSEGGRRAVQLLLYLKGLQLISSAFRLSQQQVRNGQLQPSQQVRNVLGQLKESYHLCLRMCKSLNTPGLLQSVGVDPATSSLTADKILYKYAIQMCQSAAMQELFGDVHESFQQYETAHILLHSLGEQVNDLGDKELLHKYKEAVVKRMEIIHNNCSYSYPHDLKR
ncbi:hypothetical protein JTE90_008607 [Oedothorax gibbosus]|uniref:Protein kinase domain-containing protein n=1 Tax=Oedothorax gibbosus TaxID=931172 RepID=A0AAV6UCS9_9ARAC|nr:hypothetical protein JTE90_008607 [Oedothorax gibbosus]